MLRLVCLGSYRNKNLNITCSACGGSTNADQGICSSAEYAVENHAICRHYVVPIPVSFEVWSEG